MKKLLLLSVILVLAMTFIQAQKKVLLQHAGTPSLHNSISAAITAAVANDTIYVPGSAYNENITIGKQLTIYGTGHYADSTAAPGMCRMYGNINFYTGSDGTKIEGLYISGSIGMASGQTVNGISISRCRIDGGISMAGTIDGVIISESVVLGTISSTANGTANNILIEKSVLQGNIVAFRNTSQISHCILLSNSSSTSINYHYFYDCEGIEINSNVILDYRCNFPNTCTFKNNLFFNTFTLTYPNENNIVGQAPAEIFEHLETGKEYIFDFANNYHLKSISPGIGAALDGTNIGIYGTLHPCKASAVPSNPHFYKVDIASENDVTGKLNVKLGVQAQNR